MSLKFARDAGDAVAYPRLSAAQLARLRSYGTSQTVEVGEVLYGPGDATYDLVVLEDATVEIVQPKLRDAPEESLVRFGPGSFLGELNLLTGQAVYLIARVVENNRKALLQGFSMGGAGLEPAAPSLSSWCSPN